MDLESARALKTVLIERFRTQRRLLSPLTRAAAAQQSAPAARRPPPFALGIDRTGDEHRLALRIIAGMPGLQPLVAEVCAAARGEISIRQIGRVSAQERWYRPRHHLCQPHRRGSASARDSAL